MTRGRPSKLDTMEKNREQISNVLRNSYAEVFFRDYEVVDILDELKEKGILLKTTGLEEFLSFLIDENIFEEIFIKFPRKVHHLYTFQDKKSSDRDLLKIVSHFKVDGYFSHYTAAFLHGLTENIVKTIYFSEQTSTINKSNATNLLQENIDSAFSKPARETKNFSHFEGQKIVLLENVFRSEGITTIDGFNVSNIEKTLLDITVRPNYSGGVHEVLSIYKNARERTSVNRLRAYLRKANYTYPYHQAIGFYLERAGYSDNVLRLMENFPQEYDFYLTHNMKNKKYSNRWKLYYPASLD